MVILYFLLSKFTTLEKPLEMTALQHFFYFCQQDLLHFSQHSAHAAFSAHIVTARAATGAGHLLGSICFQNYCK